jgi:hypothetical protein
MNPPPTVIEAPSARAPTRRSGPASSWATSAAESGAASGSRRAQIAVSRFDLPVLGSPTIAEIAPGRKLESFSDRKRRTWTPVSPKSATDRC